MLKSLRTAAWGLCQVCNHLTEMESGYGGGKPHVKALAWMWHMSLPLTFHQPGLGHMASRKAGKCRIARPQVGKGEELGARQLAFPTTPPKATCSNKNPDWPIPSPSHSCHMYGSGLPHLSGTSTVMLKQVTCLQRLVYPLRHCPLGLFSWSLCLLKVLGQTVHCLVLTPQSALFPKALLTPFHLQDHPPSTHLIKSYSSLSLFPHPPG